MRLSLNQRVVISALLAGIVACPPAHALVSLNDGKEKIYVSAGVTFSRDSNIFASAGGASDLLSTSSLAIEYTRKVGWIGVNGRLDYSIGSFSKFASENYKNPHYSLELTKQTGRTTGSISLSAQRSSRADASVNLRNTSWNYNAGLNFKYPIIERYSLAGSLGYSLTDYSNKRAFVDLASYSASLSLYYILSDSRDLFANYRYRYGPTSRNTSTTDNAFSLGVNGKVLPRLNGALSFGYQRRIPKGTNEGSNQGLTATGSLSWNFNRRATTTFSISKDFSTTATDVTVDTTSLTADFSYAVNSHWSAGANAGVSRSVFLGPSGFIALIGQQRRDTSYNLGANIGYSLNEHFKANFSYSFTRNVSNLDFSAFDRSAYALNLSTRW